MAEAVTIQSDAFNYEVVDEDFNHTPEFLMQSVPLHYELALMARWVS